MQETGNRAWPLDILSRGRPNRHWLTRGNRWSSCRQTVVDGQLGTNFTVDMDIHQVDRAGRGRIELSRTEHVGQSCWKRRSRNGGGGFIARKGLLWSCYSGPFVIITGTKQLKEKGEKQKTPTYTHTHKGWGGKKLNIHYNGYRYSENKHVNYHHELHINYHSFSDLIRSVPPPPPPPTLLLFFSCDKFKNIVTLERVTSEWLDLFVKPARTHVTL